LTGLALMLGALIVRMVNPDGSGVSSAVIVASTVGVVTIIGCKITPYRSAAMTEDSGRDFGQRSAAGLTGQRSQQ
jgi:hypothetical protein